MSDIIPQRMIQLATEELHSKTERDIEYETAVKWGARTIAAYQIYVRTGQHIALLSAEDYYHETLEHAALVRDGGRTVNRIQEQIDPTRQAALTLFPSSVISLPRR